MSYKYASICQQRKISNSSSMNKGVMGHDKPSLATPGMTEILLGFLVVIRHEMDSEQNRYLVEGVDGDHADIDAVAAIGQLDNLERAR